MAIYRAEQARVSFASEPGHGGMVGILIIFQLQPNRAGQEL